MSELSPSDQIHYTFNAIAYLYHGWFRYPGNRKPKYPGVKRDDGRLSLIYFDKFVNLACRLFTELYRLTDSDSISSDDDHNGIFRLLPPFERLPGKHGDGYGILNGSERRPYYFKDIIYDLVGEQIPCPFVLDPPDAPDRYNTIVELAEIKTDGADYIKAFNSLEKTILTTISAAIKRLGPSEIRALGIHDNDKMSIMQIRKEFNDSKQHISKIRNCVKEGSCFEYHAQQLLEYATEAVLKAIENKQDHQTGYKILEEEFNGSDLLEEAFSICQKPTLQVWNDSLEIKQLSYDAEILLTISKCIRAIAYFSKWPSVRTKNESRESKKYIDFLNEGYKTLPKIIPLNDFPKMDHMFEGKTNQLSKQAKECVFGLLSEALTKGDKKSAWKQLSLLENPLPG